MMMKKIFVCLFALLLCAAQSATAQSMVTVDRNRLKKERAELAQKKKKKAVGQKPKVRRQPRPVALQPQPEELFFYVNNGTNTYDSNISYSGYTRCYDVKTNDKGQFSITHLPGWAKIGYIGYAYFSIKYEVNDTHAPRTDYVELSLNGRTARVNVSQEADPANIQANFSGLYLQHNWSVGGDFNLVIGGDVKISGGKNIPCNIVAYFSDAHTGNFIKTYNTSYADHNGFLYAGRTYTPYTDDATLTPIAMSVPNQAFSLYQKKNDLVCQLYVYRQDTNECLAQTTLRFKAKWKKGKITTMDY